MTDDKRTPPTTSDAPQNSQTDSSTNEAVKLTPDEYTAIEKLIPEGSKQFRRMFKHLAFHPGTLTAELCIACASVNLSDLARKKNSLILPSGLYVDCYKPRYRIDNRFGEASSQHLWGLYRVGGK